jgi:hypothetical protein
MALAGRDAQGLAISSDPGGRRSSGLVSRPSLGFPPDHGKARISDEEDPGRHRRPVAPDRRRASASVVTTRVRVTNRDRHGPSGSAPRVYTILTYPGSAKVANTSGGSGWKVTCWCQGWVYVPTTISRFGTSARTPKPSPSISSTSPRGPGGREGWPRSRAGTARSQKMPFTIGAACRSMPLATARAVGAGASTSSWWYSSTSGWGMNWSRRAGICGVRPDREHEHAGHRGHRRPGAALGRRPDLLAQTSLCPGRSAPDQTGMAGLPPRSPLQALLRTTLTSHSSTKPRQRARPGSSSPLTEAHHAHTGPRPSGMGSDTAVQPTI